jgi:hypothetical protein
MEQVLAGVQSGDVVSADAWKVAVEAARVVDSSNTSTPATASPKP